MITGLSTLENVRRNGMRPPGQVHVYLDDALGGSATTQVGPSGEYLPVLYIAPDEPVASADFTPLVGLDVFIVAFEEGTRPDRLIARLLECGAQRIEMLRMWEEPGTRDGGDITLEAIDGQVV